MRTDIYFVMKLFLIYFTARLIEKLFIILIKIKSFIFEEIKLKQYESFK